VDKRETKRIQKGDKTETKRRLIEDKVDKKATVCRQRGDKTETKKVQGLRPIPPLPRPPRGACPFATWQGCMADGLRPAHAPYATACSRYTASRSSRYAVATRTLTPFHFDLKHPIRSSQRRSKRILSVGLCQGLGAARSDVGARTRALDIDCSDQPPALGVGKGGSAATV